MRARGRKIKMYWLFGAGAAGRLSL